jgi:hypothetical protein
VTIFAGLMAALSIACVALIVLALAGEYWRRREVRDDPDRPYYPLHATRTMHGDTHKIGPEQKRRAVQE